MHCSPDAVKVLCLDVWAHRQGVVVAKICIILVLLCSLPITEFLLYVKCVGICKEKQQLPSQFLLLFCLGCDKQGHTGDLAVHSVCF